MIQRIPDYILSVNLRLFNLHACGCTLACRNEPLGKDPFLGGIPGRAGDLHFHHAESLPNEIHH